MKYYISLGSNLGDREKNLTQAKLRLVEKGINILKSSSIYETEPVGMSCQYWFLNQILEIETGLNPFELLDTTKEIEKKLGRNPSKRNKPRTIDIDILLAGRIVIKTKHLIIPHPLMEQRNFILIPLVEIAPDEIHPGFDKSMHQLLSELNELKIVKMFNNVSKKNKEKHKDA